MSKMREEFEKSLKDPEDLKEVTWDGAQYKATPRSNSLTVAFRVMNEWSVWQKAWSASAAQDDFCHQLRKANVLRDREWNPEGVLSLSFRGNELGGEAGEAQNVIKKMERARAGLQGSRAGVGELAEELADVWICADLIAMEFGIRMDKAVIKKFNATSDKVGLNIRMDDDE